MPRGIVVNRGVKPLLQGKRHSIGDVERLAEQNIEEHAGKDVFFPERGQGIPSLETRFIRAPGDALKRSGHVRRGGALVGKQAGFLHHGDVEPVRLAKFAEGGDIFPEAAELSDLDGVRPAREFIEDRPRGDDDLQVLAGPGAGHLQAERLAGRGLLEAAPTEGEFDMLSRRGFGPGDLQLFNDALRYFRCALNAEPDVLRENALVGG